MGLKPNFWNLILTMIVSGIYYFLTYIEVTTKCALDTDKVYSSYSFLFGKCGQTGSLMFSILSVVILIIFVPITYILISYIISKIRIP